MALISPESLDRVKQAADIVEVISAHTDLRRAGAGVRAQAITRDGRLVDDFLLVDRGPLVHVLNAPSPAATASLPIGAEIATRVAAHLDN